MKYTLPAIAAAALLSAFPLHVASSEKSGDQLAPSLMLYMAVPLEGSPREKDAVKRFGFRLDQARGSSMTIDRDRMNEPVNLLFASPALVDFSMNGNRLPDLKISGYNALTYSYVSNVAGGAVVAGVNWAYVGYGVVAAFAVDMELDNDKPAEPDPCLRFTLNIAC